MKKTLCVVLLTIFIWGNVIAQSTNQTTTGSNSPVFTIPSDLELRISRILERTNPPPAGYHEEGIVKNWDYINGKTKPAPIEMATEMVPGEYWGRESNLIGLIHGEIFINYDCFLSIERHTYKNGPGQFDFGSK
ncbi:MAG: hypothetical protein WCG27_03180, partial [Pseudomonadota bacterium]